MTPLLTPVAGSPGYPWADALADAETDECELYAALGDHDPGCRRQAGRAAIAAALGLTQDGPITCGHRRDRSDACGRPATSVYLWSNRATTKPFPLCVTHAVTHASMLKTGLWGDGRIERLPEGGAL